MLGSRFKYKGTENEDLPKLTSIFKRINEELKIALMHRSSSQSDMKL